MRLSPMAPVCKPHQHFEKTQDFLLDIAPFPLCIESTGGIMTALLSSVTLFPSKNLHTGCSYTNKGKTECLNQGQQLPQYIWELSGIPPAPCGIHWVELTFDNDASGILIVAVLDKTTGKSNCIAITNEKGCLSKGDWLCQWLKKPRNIKVRLMILLFYTTLS